MKLISILLFMLSVQFLLGQDIERRFRFKAPEPLERIVLPNNADSLSIQHLDQQLLLNKRLGQVSDKSMTNDSLAQKSAEYKRMQKLFGSYDNFKHKFLALELKNQMPDLGSYNAYADLYQIKNPVGMGGFGVSIPGPISYLYGKYNKEEVSRRRVNALKNSEPARRRVNAKYNQQKIQQWTGLKDRELTAFVVFCHFDDGYLLAVNEYELIDTVLRKLKEFKAQTDTCN